MSLRQQTLRSIVPWRRDDSPSSRTSHQALKRGNHLNWGRQPSRPSPKWRRYKIESSLENWTIFQVREGNWARGSSTTTQSRTAIEIEILSTKELRNRVTKPRIQKEQSVPNQRQKVIDKRETNNFCRRSTQLLSISLPKSNCCNTRVHLMTRMKYFWCKKE